MSPRQRSRLLLSLLSVLTASLPAGVWACSVPVFRYALEHWVPDIYEALVFHEGELSGPQRALLGEFGGNGTGSANVRVRTIRLDSPENSDWREAWKSLGGDSLPWIAVRPDPRSGLVRPILSSPFDSEHVAPLLRSPARDTIASRLASGESAVWILLESGDSAADESAARTLRERLEYLGSVLALPELDPSDIAEGLVSVGSDDLRLAFSILRLSREAPGENVFIDMLLATEPDLATLGEPIVFPVFGRGRVLYALAGGGIRSETIDEAAQFLIGRCSCQVKEENPGADLLVSADWEAMVRPKQGMVEPDLAGASPDRGLPVVVKIEPSASAPATGKNTLILSIALAAGTLALLALVLLDRLARHRGRKS